MEKIELNRTIIAACLGLLKRLSHEGRLELIEQLSNSLTSDDRKSNRDFLALYGSFKSKRSAHQIVKDIRDSRNFSRQTEEF